MQTRPMTNYRGTPVLTRFDPIAHTPGTPDYVARAAAPIRGVPRASVVNWPKGSSHSPAPVSSFAVDGENYVVPSVPRRNYIPTVSKVELL